MNVSNIITHNPGTKSILDLSSLYDHGHLNLEPGFQRQTVWKLRDRAFLIDSILRNYPLPAIFPYKREEKGELVYDVIDGKQRLESILLQQKLVEWMGEHDGQDGSVRGCAEGSRHTI